jgi:hypothetical protein
LPATINAAIIKPPRHQFAILIVAGFSSRLSRYSQADMTRPSFLLIAAQHNDLRENELVPTEPR